MIGTNGPSAHEALSDYVKSVVGMGTDDLLLQGCLDGRLRGHAAELARVDATRVGSRTDHDGAEVRSYEGRVSVDGVVCRFACDIRHNAARETYTIAVLTIEPLEWTAASFAV